MIKPKQIPDEVAFVLLDIYAIWHGDMEQTRAAIAAVINAWPGRVVHQDVKKNMPEFFQIGVFLPTPSEWPQEKNDD